jgi:hypothetical protein
VFILSTPDGTRNLMFMEANAVLKEEDIDFSFVSHEGEKCVLLDMNSPMAFPLHKMALERYLKNNP